MKVKKDYLTMELLMVGAERFARPGIINLIGEEGFEPSTSWSRTKRASQAALLPAVFPLICEFPARH